MAPQVENSTEDPEAILYRDFNGLRILIADDDAFVRDMLVEMLAYTGLHVDLADGGMAAVQMTSLTGYDLILMDMQMPDLSGLDATLQIRKLPGMAHTPILAITGNASIKDRLHCLEAGMNDFVSKPTVPAALAAVILVWLRAVKR